MVFLVQPVREVPELPEVETVRAGLETHVLGREIRAVEVYRDYSVRHQLHGVPALYESLVGRSFNAAVRRGKFLWLPLAPASSTGPLDPHDEPNQAMMVHLGMSGQLLVNPVDSDREHVEISDLPRGNHVRVRLLLGVDQPVMLDFVDQRTFGHISTLPLVPTSDGFAGGQGSALAMIPESATHIARDLLDPAVDFSVLANNVRRRKTGIKRALLDQRIMSGIGNIYADEALWLASMHYATPANTLSQRRAIDVLEAAAEVMSAALSVGGTSFDALYVNVNGASGYFSRSLNVYGQEGKPCVRCGTPVVREKFMNRSSFFCPRCQRRSR